jgi:hypothetical protein
MMNPGTRIFIQIPDAQGKAMLHPASVLEVVHDSITAISTEAVRQLETGSECHVLFEHLQEFMQQSVQVDAIMPTTSEPELETMEQLDLQSSDQLCVFGFRTVGEPVSAEQRQCYRVSTVMYPVRATIEGETDCQVLDVSATGFSVLTEQSHDPGSVLEATLHYDGADYQGRVSTQNVLPHRSGQYRLGLYGIKKSNGQCELSKGSRIINTSIQRQQLRRLTGSD